MNCECGGDVTQVPGVEGFWACEDCDTIWTQEALEQVEW